MGDAQPLRHGRRALSEHERSQPDANHLGAKLLAKRGDSPEKDRPWGCSTDDALIAICDDGKNASDPNPISHLYLYNSIGYLVNPGHLEMCQVPDMRVQAVTKILRCD